MRHQQRIQLLLFYVLCALPDSARYCANAIKTEISGEYSYHLLSAAAQVKLQDRPGNRSDPCSMKEVLLDSRIGEALLRTEQNYRAAFDKLGN
jgi:hypothetical protein